MNTIQYNVQYKKVIWLENKKNKNKKWKSDYVV